MFVLNEDPARGVKTVGWFEPDGQITVQVRQYVPDQLFKQIEYVRETQGTKGPRCISMMPDTLKASLLVDSDGKPFHLRDPERKKKMRQIDNDIDYRKFRVWEGRV